jgi:hypothetical protein
MMVLWRLGSLVAYADAGPEDEALGAPEGPQDLQVASLQGQGQTPPHPLLPRARRPEEPLPLCPDGRASCRAFCTVAEPGSVLWDGMVDRDVSGPRGAWTKKRGRG